MRTVQDNTSPDEILRMLKPLFDEADLRLVLLFGSAGSGIMHKQSDIDLAFLCDAEVDIVSLTNRVSRLLHTDAIDVVDLQRASPLLKFSVAKNGVLLYEKREGLFHEFYSLAFRMYVDSMKLRAAQETAIKSFLTSRGLS